jgi:multiple sugar transport system substrate-binding protein
MSDDRRDAPAVVESPLSVRTRRRELLVAGGTSLAGMSVLGLLGCGDEDGGATGDVLLSISPDVKAIINEQVKTYNDDHPDGNVSVRIMPADTTAYFDRLRTQFQAGGSDIDVIMGDIIWPPQFASNGWIADLSDLFTEDERSAFIPGVIEGNTYEDQIYGVPWFTDSGLLYYRSDLLEDSGYSDPPQTWEELQEMAAKVQRDAGTPNGFVFTGARYEGGTVLGIEFIRTAGGDVLDGDTVIVDSPEAIDGLTTQQTLVSEGIAPEAVANYQEDQASGAFLRGDSVFMRMWPYAYDFLGDKELSELDDNQVGLTQVPVASPDIERTNVGGGFNFFINAEAADEDAAWELIQFLTDTEQQKTLAIEGSYLPTRTELYDDPEIIKTLPAVRLGRDAVENTTTPPVSPYYSDMSLAMSEQFNSNILGDVTPEEAAANIKQELESIIERGG